MRPLTLVFCGIFAFSVYAPIFAFAQVQPEETVNDTMRRLFGDNWEVDPNNILLNPMATYVGIGVSMKVTATGAINSSEKETKKILVIVNGLVCGGPADKAGIKIGDIVTMMNEYRVGTSLDEYESGLTSITSGDIGATKTLVIRPFQDYNEIRTVVLKRELIANPVFKENCDSK